MTSLTEQILRGVFSEYTSTYTEPYIKNPLIRQDVFSKYFVIESENGNFEIPMFVKTIVEDKLVNMVIDDILKLDEIKIIIPLYCNSEIQHKRVFNSMIKSLFSTSSYRKRMVCIKRNDEIIYGNRGILLDKDFNIMFLCTAECKKDGNFFKYTKLKVYINPLTFQHQDDFLNKQIIKTLIPFYLNTTIDRVSSNYNFLNELSDNIDVIIEDPNKFVYSSTIVKPESFSNDDINDIVLKNIMQY